MDSVAITVISGYKQDFRETERELERDYRETRDYKETDETVQTQT